MQTKHHSRLFETEKSTSGAVRKTADPSVMNNQDHASITSVKQLNQLVGNRALGQIIQGKLKKGGDEEKDQKQLPGQLKSSNLSRNIRTKMESSFQTDFSAVNIHQSSQKAKDMDALAYTKGNDIHFAPGQFNPHTSGGLKLLGHELTHVIQQRQGRVKPTTEHDGVPINDDKSLEQEADLKADSLLNDISKPKNVEHEQSPVGQKSEEKGIQKTEGCEHDGGVIQGSFWDYLKSVGTALLALPHGWIISNLRRIPQLIWHILKSLKLFKWLWQGFLNLIRVRNETFAQWLLRGMASGATWLGQLFTKALDVVGIGEIIGFIFQLFNIYTRKLNAAEIAAARIVYGGFIPYWKVRINTTAHQPITRAYNWITGAGGGFVAIGAFHYIEIGPAHAAQLNNVVHELGHVLQQETVGSQYMAEAIYAGTQPGGYDYNADDLRNHRMSFFNREQQCRIAEHYWALMTNATIPAAIAAVPTLGGVGINVAVANAIAAGAVLPGGGPPVGLAGNMAIARAMYYPRIREFKWGLI